MKASKVIIQMLQKYGVRRIFSLSGNQIMPLYDACIDSDIKIVHVRHEAAAVFMAEAWSQVTGELGVAMITAGPGITNAISPIYSALTSESPVLIISGDSPVSQDGTGAFQELDQISITRPLTKRSIRPKNISEVIPSVKDLIVEATSARQGPVHLAIPFDILNSEIDINEFDVDLEIRVESKYFITEDKSIEFESLINKAINPIVITGPSGARCRFRDSLNKIKHDLLVPVVSIESPRGLKAPYLGSVEEVIKDVDLVILAGKRIDFTLNFLNPPVFSDNTKFILIDADEDELYRGAKILGDKLLLSVLGDPIKFLSGCKKNIDSAAREQWVNRVERALKNRFYESKELKNKDALHPKYLCEEINKFISECQSPIVICDGGEFGQWAQAYCDSKIKIINGISGAIGGGICYGIAAKIASPNSTVIVLMGDGTAGFHLMELDTAVREDAPIISIIGNDFRWNAEELIQIREYGKDRLIGCDLSKNANYHDVAVALGGYGEKLDNLKSIEDVLRLAISSGLPSCINVCISNEAAPIFSNKGG